MLNILSKWLQTQSLHLRGCKMNAISQTLENPSLSQLSSTQILFPAFFFESQYEIFRVFNIHPTQTNSNKIIQMTAWEFGNENENSSFINASPVNSEVRWKKRTKMENGWNLLHRRLTLKFQSEKAFSSGREK